MSPRLSNFHIVIVHISGKIFAVDHTFSSYEDFMDLHSSSGDKNVMVGQNVMVGHALLPCNVIGHTCGYFGALDTKGLVLGRICGYKNKLLF